MYLPSKNCDVLAIFIFVFMGEVAMKESVPGCWPTQLNMVKLVNLPKSQVEKIPPEKACRQSPAVNGRSHRVVQYMLVLSVYIHGFGRDVSCLLAHLLLQVQHCSSIHDLAISVQIWGSLNLKSRGSLRHFEEKLHPHRIHGSQFLGHFKDLATVSCQVTSYLRCHFSPFSWLRQASMSSHCPRNCVDFRAWLTSIEPKKNKNISSNNVTTPTPQKFKALVLKCHFNVDGHAPDQESQDFIKQRVSWCFMLHPAHPRNVYGRGHFSGGFSIRIIEKTILILTPTISWNLSDSHVVGWRRPSLK